MATSLHHDMLMDDTLQYSRLTQLGTPILGSYKIRRYTYDTPCLNQPFKKASFICTLIGGGRRGAGRMIAEENTRSWKIFLRQEGTGLASISMLLSACEPEIVPNLLPLLSASRCQAQLNLK